MASLSPSHVLSSLNSHKYSLVVTIERARVMHLWFDTQFKEKKIHKYLPMLPNIFLDSIL